MPAAAKIQVVVVDDQLTMRALVRSGLQQIGISQEREFAGAAEALQNLAAQSAHMIISEFFLLFLVWFVFFKR